MFRNRRLAADPARGFPAATLQSLGLKQMVNRQKDFGAEIGLAAALIAAQLTYLHESVRLLVGYSLDSVGLSLPTVERMTAASVDWLVGTPGWIALATWVVWKASRRT